jgi:transcriptional regulator with XRE-family HTH domain
MSTINALLDKAKERRSIASDNALAAVFDVKRQTVSKWRNGDAYPSEEHIARLAEMAEMDQGLCLIKVQAERASGRAADALMNAVRKLESLAATLCLTIGGIVALTLPAYVSAAARSMAGASLYIM